MVVFYLPRIYADKRRSAFICGNPRLYHFLVFHAEISFDGSPENRIFLHPKRKVFAPENRHFTLRQRQRGFTVRLSSQQRALTETIALGQHAKHSLLAVLFRARQLHFAPPDDVHSRSNIALQHQHGVLWNGALHQPEQRRLFCARQAMKNATLDRPGVGAKRLRRDHDVRVLVAGGRVMTVAVCTARDVVRRAEPRRPRKRGFSAQFHNRNLIRLQHQTHVELKLVLNVEPHEIAEHAEAPLGGQKTLEVFPTEWTKFNLEARLLVPHTSSHHACVTSESLVRTGFANLRPLVLFKLAPLTDKLLDLNVDLKVVSENPLQSGHRSRLLGQYAGVIKQRPIPHVHSALQARRAHSDK